MSEPRLVPTKKWIRARLDGRIVLDSRRARLVQYPPGPTRTYAVPPEDAPGVPDAARFEVPDGFVGVTWEAMDRWYEEDEEVHVNPRDPFHRVDAIPSSRHVVVRLDGEVLAESRRPTLVFETSEVLPVRYYLPHDAVDWSRLRSSDTVTHCPYKGRATYHDVRAGDGWHEDLVWTYLSPLREVEPVRGLLCFFNEHVDLEVDGQVQARPSAPG